VSEEVEGHLYNHLEETFKVLNGAFHIITSSSERNSPEDDDDEDQSSGNEDEEEVSCLPPIFQ
jgi:hypothetical protein